MTFLDWGILFRLARNFLASCLALFLVAALPACATATIDDAVPQSADSTLPAGPIDTRTYPNLNIAPVAAAAQLTPAERAAKEAELQAARAQIAAQGGEPVPDDDQQLRLLGQTHAGEILRQIENE